MLHIENISKTFFPSSPEPALQGEPAMIGSHVIIEAPNPVPSATNFFEVWAYLIAGSEEYLKPEYPITDLGYFRT